MSRFVPPSLHGWEGGSLERYKKSRRRRNGSRERRCLDNVLIWRKTLRIILQYTVTIKYCFGEKKSRTRAMHTHTHERAPVDLCHKGTNYLLLI